MKSATAWLAVTLCASAPAIAWADIQSAPALLSASAPSATNSGPRIEFAEPIFDFNIAAAGDVLKHIFYFTNTGKQVLEVTNVHPGCGCTTAGDWTKRIEPGRGGAIPIQFKTTEFTGPVEKTVEVRSTDPSQPLITLKIKGTVWRDIEVTPQWVFLNYLSEAPTNPWTTVKIVNNLEVPLTLWPPECTQPAIAVELRTNEPGREYQLFATIKPPIDRGMQGQITIKTSFTNTPEIRLSAMVYQEPVVTFFPRQVIVPAPPLAKPSTNIVRIFNQGTNRVTLSDPTINCEGVAIELKEIVPGSNYLATLVFPQGFTHPPGQITVFTVKTSHPKYPQIKVPVLQMARTADQAAGRPARSPNPPATPIDPTASPGTPTSTGSGQGVQRR
jgi:uncharacterized protein DUF1573